MATIIAYNNPLEGKSNQCFCQLRFEDGVRILISQSREGIKIFRLFLGFLPIKRLFEAGFTEIAKHEKIIGSEYSKPLLMDCYVEKIKLLNRYHLFLQLIKSS